VRVLALVVFGVLLSACAAPAPPTQEELQPSDFAYGLTITAPSDLPFFRVSLPVFVFQETVWADQRDLRVFNADGEPVPLARVVPPVPPAATERVSLRSFRLAAPPAPGSLPQIELDAEAHGVELRVFPGPGTESGAEYLLASDGELKAPVERLHLDWSDRTSNWQQSVTVAASADLQSWNTVASRRLVLDLATDDGQRLKQGEIQLGQLVQPSYRYWRVQFDPGAAPSLTTVEAEVRTEIPPPPGVRLPAAREAQTDGSAVYALSSPQPVRQLRITPSTANSVLPLEVEGREEANGPWRSLGRTVAYRLTTQEGEQSSPPMPLSRGLVQAVRLRPIGTTWGATPPEVVAEREPLLIVANARGGGPFLLAWGSRVAADTSVPFTTLVPGHSLDRVATLPEGVFGKRQELGGVSRLTAEAPAERAARWQTVMVWLSLVGGAGLLAMLAFRVWRESNV
jgi:hypothetical protein